MFLLSVAEIPFLTSLEMQAAGLPPSPPSQLSILPSALPERPVLRRVPYSFFASAAGSGKVWPVRISFRGAGFSGSAQLVIRLRNQQNAGAPEIVHLGTILDGSSFQGFVDVPERVVIPPTAFLGWYDILVSLQKGAQNLDCIPGNGTTEASPGLFQVGELLITDPVINSNSGLSLYSFDEPAGSTEFFDSLGNRWPLFRTTLALPDVGVTTPFGRGLRFNGSFTLPRNIIVPKQQIPEPPFTIGYWFNLQKPASLVGIASSGTYAQDGLRIGLLTRGTNLLAAAWANQNGGTLELIATNRIRTNEWHHVALTYDGHIGIFYLDGQAQARQTNGTIIPASGGLYLQGASSSGQETFQGFVDELILASFILTPEDISRFVNNYRVNGAVLGASTGNAPAFGNIPEQQVRAGQPLQLILPVFDPDGDLRSLTSSSLPSGATLDASARTFFWTPGFQQVGHYNINIQAGDGKGHIAISTLSIEVLPNSAPALDAYFRYPLTSTNLPKNQPQLIRMISNMPNGLAREGFHVVLEHTTNADALVRVISFRGETVYQGKFGVLPLLPPGHYFIETPGDRHHLTVLPKDYNGSSFMGTMADDPNDPVAMKHSATINPTYKRIGEIGSWTQIEKVKGTYTWTALDQWIATNRAPGKKLMVMMVTDFPSWTLGQSETYFISELTRFTRDYVRRYKGKIDILEPFNEPALIPSRLTGIQGITLSDFYHAADFLERCYAEVAKVVKSELGNTNIIAGPTWEEILVPFDRMQAVMGAAGLATNIIAGDFHDYLLGRRAPDGASGGGFYNIPKTSEIVRMNSGNAPFFVTEFGLQGVSAFGYASDPTASALEPYGVSGLSWWQGYRRALVALFMYHGSGAKSVLPHDFFQSHGLEICGRESAPSGGDRGYKPQASAYIMACYWLDQAVPVSHLERAGKMHIYASQKPNGESLATAWALEGNSVPMDPAMIASLLQDTDVKIHDVFGREFTPTAFGDEPLIFRSKQLTPAILAQRIFALDQSGCDGIIAAGTEECDCRNLGGNSCESLGYGSGTLRCSGTNTFDVSGCQYTKDPHLLLTASYAFEETSGNTVHDGSIHNLSANLITPYLSKSWITSTRGRVLHFEGIPTNIPKEMLIIPNSSNQVLPAQATPFTIAFWVKIGTRNPTNWMALMTCEQFGVSGFRMALPPSGQIAWWTQHGGGNISIVTPSVPSPGVWHHVAITYTPTRVRMFLDGLLVNELNDTLYIPAARDIVFGHALSGTGVDPFRGEIDDLRFYSRDLTPNEIGRLVAP